MTTHLEWQSTGEDLRWRALYRVAGIAALTVVALILVGGGTFMIAPPPPASATAADWFALFRRSPFMGAMELDLAMLLSYVALVPVMLGLYLALRRHGESTTALALAFGLVGTATYLASSPILEMLALSARYAAATTDAQRALLEAAGQGKLTGYLGAGTGYGGTAFSAGYILWSICGIMMSAVILRGGTFRRATGWLGIAGFITALGLFLPRVGIFVSLVSLLLQLPWLALVAQGFFHAARGVAPPAVAGAGGG